MNDEILLKEIKDNLDYLDSNIKTVENLIKDNLVCKKNDEWLDTIISNQLQVQNTRQVIVSAIKNIGG